MKKILISTLLILPLFASAQKLLKPSVDKITSDTTWATSKEKIYMHGNYLTGQGEGVLSVVEKIKTGKEEAVVLILNVQTVNQRAVYSIVKGGKAYLKLSDNSIITLTSSTLDFGNPRVGLAGDMVITTGSAFGLYDLSREDIEKIKANTVTFLRVETTTGNFDCDIKPKSSDILKKQIELVEAGK
ncbi:hypothetical protein C8P68_105382 [Mucilaginibacter yixingensis]|uniref:Uncharacterized protein n=1 Tax=Mucilaginibacter yixingensis TaxID=1295612 RepID=A0A2T5J8U8_9SPHI|nr:hypothetical protein [Mucilaginibacter yixingensis]PTQ95871.1 hypothetical protein C8P68_105382 [Mucilaginibacter yixingensis]